MSRAGSKGPPGTGDVDPQAPTLAGQTVDATLTVGSRGLPIASPSLDVGASIGRYLVRGVLGRGGMGVVYRAHDPDLERPVAIKVLRPELRQIRRRLLREGQAVARLRHPNVITVYDVGVEGDDLFIAMELVDGGTLREWLAEPRPWRAVVERFVEAGRGLAAAHAAGLVHRDFKPDNVLLGSDGRVVVGDFGIAQDAPEAPEPFAVPDADADPAHTAGLAGTPAYMAPEQFRGETADTRTDQFSFCVALWDALYQTRPFHAADPSSVDSLAHAVVAGDLRDVRDRRGVPARIHAALRRGLSMAPADRFPTLDALLATLAPRRRRWLLPAVIAATAAAAVIATVLLRPPPARVVAAAPACEASAPDAGGSAGGREAWLARYGAELALARRSRCVATAVRGQVEDDRVAACLDAAGAALATETARPPATRWWPQLPPLPSCFGDGTAGELRVLLAQVALNERQLLSPDGTRLAAQHNDQRARIRDLASGAEVLLPPGWLLRWRDDATLVLRSDVGALVVTASTGAIEEEIRFGAGAPVEVSSDLQRAVMVDGDTVRLVDRAHPEDGVVVVERAIARHVAGAWFSPDDATVCVSTRGELTCRDVASGRQTTTAIGLSSPFGAIPIGWIDARTIVLGGAPGPGARQSLWRVRFSDDLTVARAPEPVRDAGTSAFFVVEDASAGRVAFTRLTIAENLEVRRPGYVVSGPSTLEGARAIWAAADGSHFLARTSSRYVRVELPEWTVHPIAVSEEDLQRVWDVQEIDGRVVALARDGERTILAELTEGGLTGRPIPEELAGGATGLRCRAEVCIVYGVVGGTVTVHRADRDGFTPLARFEADEVSRRRVYAVDVTADGRQLVVSTNSPTLYHYDVARQVLRPLLDDSCGGAQFVRFAPDDRSVLVSCIDESYALRRIDLATGAATEVSSSTTIWITGVEVLGGDDLLVGTRTHAGSLELMTFDEGAR